MNKWPIIWHQAVTISCAWTPLENLRRKGKAEGDILVQQFNNDKEVSIFSDPIYGDVINLEGNFSVLFFLNLKIQLIIIYINQALHFSHAKLQ